jgi:hypothetical protein
MKHRRPDGATAALFPRQLRQRRCCFSTRHLPSRSARATVRADEHARWFVVAAVSVCFGAVLVSAVAGLHPGRLLSGESGRGTGEGRRDRLIATAEFADRLC